MAANVTTKQALDLDKNQQLIFIKYFKGLGEKPATTIRFFDRNEYYSLHGEDAIFASKCVFKSTVNVKLMSPSEADSLEYVCLNKNSFENFARELLLVKNYRIEIFVSQSRNNWNLEFRGSPGNLIQFEDLLFGSNDINVGTGLLAVTVKIDQNKRFLGIAFCEHFEREFSVIEFMDDDFYTELEAVVVLLGPRECLLPSGEGEYGKIKDIVDRNGILTTIRKKADFVLDRSDLISDLNKLLHFEKGQQENANALTETTKELAMCSLGALIKYLNLVNDGTNFGNFTLKLLNLNRFVHLDAAAISALNLLPDTSIQPGSLSAKVGSVLGVLDRCRTPQGHRLMAQWVKQPLRNEAVIKDRLDIVECLINGSSTRIDLYEDYLKRIPDILQLAKKLMRKKASLQDVYKLYQVVIRLPRIITLLEDLENSAVQSVIIGPMNDMYQDLQKYRDMVEQVLDFEGVQRDEYFVKASFDDDLNECKQTMDELEAKIKNLQSKVADNLNLDDGVVKLDFVSHIGYHFRITLKDETAIRKNNKYKIIDAVKGGVRFTNEKLEELNSDFVEAKQTYEEQQKSIVEDIIKVAVGYLIPLTCLNGQIAQLDCLVSLAVAAVSAPIPYVRPKILAEGSGRLEFKQLRHPCLELQEDMTFIANDVQFVRDDTHMYLITGPNMGGKSTYIRSVGVATLMALIGSFVPCENATVSIVDSILGRVGANDNLMKGLSTFMVEMIETAGIIRTATENSLVIIDELGRGTSTYEGCGIAWSIAEHLAKNVKCFSLFATHFHEITQLANDVETVKNYHVATIADKDTFTLLYQLKPGVMDKSFGIHIAKLANFPSEVIKTAESVYSEYDDDIRSEEAKTFLDKLMVQMDNELLKRNVVTAADIEKFMAVAKTVVEQSDIAEIRNTFQI